MKKLVEGFAHRPGVHCDSTALRDIFEYYGFKFTEPMVFGLGSGLGFIYWTMKRMPYPFVGGRARDLDQSLCDNLGVKMRVHATQSRIRAYESLRELIGQDTPVLLHVDMPYLRYLNLPPEAHFGGHSVVVAGLDEDNGIAYIADTQFPKLQKATLRELEEARASQHKPFPPKNAWLTFQFPRKLTPLDKAIKTALRKTTGTMLNPPIRNLGVKGIRLFSTEIAKWPELLPPDNALYRVAYDVTYIMLEEDGTGGAAFRNLFSQFLKEAGEVMNNQGLIKCAEEYNRIAQKWTRVAKLIRTIPEETITAQESSAILREIAQEETRALSFLRRAV